jgi:cytidylate kinase
MPTGPIDLITVSREFGAGGSEFARELGVYLGWPVLDQALVHRVAERMKLDDATVEQLDEHPPSRLARLATALLLTPPEAPVTLDTSHVLPPDAVARAAHTAITEAAQSPPLIIVGHGTQCIFADRPGTLHVRLVAPLDDRVKRAAARLGSDARTTEALARRMDQDRNAYVMRYYHRDRADPLLYDVQFNTGRMPIPTAIAMVGTLVKSTASDIQAITPQAR